MNWRRFVLEAFAMVVSIASMLVMVYAMSWFGWYPVDPDAVGMAALGTGAYLFSRHLIDGGST